MRAPQADDERALEVIALLSNLPHELSMLAAQGLVCIHCGQGGGAMTPYGLGPYGQVFAHPDCEGEL